MIEIPLLLLVLFAVGLVLIGSVVGRMLSSSSVATKEQVSDLARQSIETEKA